MLFFIRYSHAMAHTFDDYHVNISAFRIFSVYSSPNLRFILRQTCGLFFTNTLLYRHVDEKEHPKPAFMMIVTGTNVAYKDDNGVYVVPLACLKP